MATTKLGRVTLIPKGEYSSTTEYTRLDVVTLDGSSYMCKVYNCIGHMPPNSVYWQLLSEKGSKGDKGDQGEQGEKGETGERSPYIESDHALAEEDHASASALIAELNTATESIKEISLGVWPMVLISKSYYGELQADADKWNAFLTRYDNYLLIVGATEETGPVTPTPSVTTFRGFGSQFGFMFGSGATTFRGFGSQFGFMFGSLNSIHNS